MSIIFAILIFSFLIFVHELGHFITAKLSGVQVNEFAMFMGPAIWKKKKGETLYSIRCIPIGGYCAMEGEDELTDNPRAFRKAKWWKQLIILVAGSFMNFVAGVLIMVIVFMPAKGFVTTTISEIEQGSLIGGEYGLQAGDTFLEIDGEKIYVQSDLSTILSLNPGEVHDIVVERNGEKVVLNDFEMKKVTFPGEDTARFGISFITEEATFATKLSYAWKNVLNAGRIVRLSLQMLVTGQVGIADMAGPVGIVDQMSDVADEAETKLDAVLSMRYFGGFIAINLAIMNMLPIPALDGGRVFALLITTVIVKITKKPVNPKVEGYIHGVGMVLLLAFMALIMFKDIFMIFKR